MVRRCTLCFHTKAVTTLIVHVQGYIVICIMPGRIQRNAAVGQT